MCLQKKIGKAPNRLREIYLLNDYTWLILTQLMKLVNNWYEF